MSEETKNTVHTSEEEQNTPVTEPEEHVQDVQDAEAAQEASAETENGTEETPADGEAGEEISEEAPAEAKSKTSIFGMKKKEKEKYEQQIGELTDRLKRSMAEFDNFRKRTEKEKASMYIIGAKDIVEKMLPVVDNFERGLAQAAEGDAFAEGMKMIYKQLMTTLEELGVKPIEALGNEFDPNFHNAVMHIDDESVGENIVVEELQKGYTYKDFVVRHSMVKVAN